jgi:hypothetical protein
VQGHSSDPVIHDDVIRLLAKHQPEFTWDEDTAEHWFEYVVRVSAKAMDGRQTSLWIGCSTTHTWCLPVSDVQQALPGVQIWCDQRFQCAVNTICALAVFRPAKPPDGPGL